MKKKNKSDKVMTMDQETTTKKYDLTVLLESEEQAEKLLALLKGIEAENIELKGITKVKLAYPVNKLESAFMAIALFEAKPDKIQVLNKKFRMEPGFLRAMIIHARPEPQSRPADAARPKPQPAEKPGKTDALPPEEFLSNEKLEETIEKILQ